jgi:hypothetical protein
MILLHENRDGGSCGVKDGIGLTVRGPEHGNMGIVLFADKWSRLSSVSWDEVRARVEREVTKRADLALYRMGAGARTPRLREYAGVRQKFFFDEGEAGERAKLLRTHLPGEANAIVKEADEIGRHEFRLLGYEKLKLGAEIDWHLGNKNRRDPWFKINFLDFAAAGDHKLVWELNRHQHLVTLGKAWLLTDNSKYADEIVAQWYTWRRENPYPLGINWASTLEVGFRSISWLWVKNLLAGCGGLPEEWNADLLRALQENGRYIERYLSTYFSPNTHLLGEAVALFFIGVLCPEIRAAKRWRDEGWQIVLREAERQVRPDGVYFEQALYYHVYALDFFLHARTLAAANRVEIPERFDNVLKKMLEVIQALGAMGSMEGFGDDDGGRVFNPRRNRVECMNDPLALGAVVYGTNYAGASLTEEAIWMFGEKAVKAIERSSAGQEAAGIFAARAFLAGGIYLMCDEQLRQQMMIDAGPQGMGKSGHGHADALSIRFAVDGRRILVDPGTYRYVSDGNDREEFRGTAAHNTLTVDREDQAVAQGPFAWSAIPRVTAETWLNGKTFDFFAGSHDGYRRLRESVLHRRFVFHVKGGLWFVRDVAEGQGKHLLETFWHFAPEIEVKTEGGVVDGRLRGENAGVSVSLVAAQTSVWASSVTDGFVSPAYGCRETAPVLRMGCDANSPIDCGVVILPFVDAASVGELKAFGDISSGKARGFHYQTSETSELLFFADENVPWTCGNWASDARFVYCSVRSGRLAHVIMISGTFCEWRGKRIVSTAAREEIFEWQNTDGMTYSSSGKAFVLENVEIDDSDVVGSVR